MNNLAVIIPFYKRPQLTKLCFKNLLDQSKRLGFDVFVCGSEGKKSKAIAKGFNYIEEDNVLGTKLNALLTECRSYDGVLLLGSDDFISDSVIKMYQEIDTTKEVYYSFNDIYIYSARFKKIVSDLDYTRGGNGIGAGRLFTKPALQKVKYRLWDDEKRRGMDGNCSETFRKAGVKEVLLDLNDLFLIDVKIDYNLTAQDIVNTGHKEHPITLLTDHLGDLGKEILSIKPSDVEHVRRVKLTDNILPMKKQKGLVLIAFGRFEKGKAYEFKPHNFKALITSGHIEAIAQIEEKPKKEVKKVEAKKPTTKKAPAKKKATSKKK